MTGLLLRADRRFAAIYSSAVRSLVVRFSIWILVISVSVVFWTTLLVVSRAFVFFLISCITMLKAYFGNHILVTIA